MGSDPLEGILAFYFCHEKQQKVGGLAQITLQFWKSESLPEALGENHFLALPPVRGCPHFLAYGPHHGDFCLLWDICFRPSFLFYKDPYDWAHLDNLPMPRPYATSANYLGPCKGKTIQFMGTRLCTCWGWHYSAYIYTGSESHLRANVFLNSHLKKYNARSVSGSSV